MRNTLRERLEFEGIATAVASREELSDDFCLRKGYDAVIAGADTLGVEKLGVPFIIITSSGSIEEAVAAVKCGAEDYLTSPVDMNRLLGSLRRIVQREDSMSEHPPMAAPRHKRKAGGDAEHIIGSSAAINHVRELIDKVALSDARVLITGENGTGKELVARWLHEKSSRSGAPFVEV
ncbi:MAG: sigma 54-interacting transcriptional regulator, partial [Alistipes sp.]|nr:sigma 54-interacting transcriptional regulator [Alistipes sp.]